MNATFNSNNTTVKIWTKEEIKNLIMTNDKMVERSVLKLYDYQTKEEQYDKNTTEENGVGFNSFDASFLTSIAEQLKRKIHLTRKQIEITRKKLIKYSGQLTKIANNKI